MRPFVNLGHLSMASVDVKSLDQFIAIMDVGADWAKKVYPSACFSIGVCTCSISSFLASLSLPAGSTGNAE